MGVYGMLAIALLVFCLRYLLRPEDWSERLVGFSFWALNLGLAWMVFVNLFPLGVLQLADVVTNGYWHARSLEFFEKHAYIEWLRLPGDVVFIVGVLPLLYLTAKSVLRPAGVRSASGRPAGDSPSPLYSIEPAGTAGV
jgi:nitric oxide reductase subunit B